MLMRLDLWLWNLLVPNMNVDFFKHKINSFLVIVYVSMYKLPRKFLANYFFGNGKTVAVDSRKLIVRNHLVLNKLKEALQPDTENSRASGFVNICQTDVFDPNYRYSVGSFRINYLRKNEIVRINIHANYRFQESPNRLTKHLHHWLFSLKQGGKASDFRIEGNDWVVTMNELYSVTPYKTTGAISRLRLLV